MIKISISGVNKELNKVLTEVKKRVGLSSKVDLMLSDLKSATPVDTGNARDSWRKTIGPNGSFIIENDAEYIQILNQGTSKQAPERFIEATVLQYGVPAGEVVQTRE